jgi:hypothetical protein
VAAADLSDLSAGPAVERDAQLGTRLCHRTKTETLWFAASAARAASLSDVTVGWVAVVVVPDVDGDVDVELA